MGKGIVNFEKAHIISPTTCQILASHYLHGCLIPIIACAHRRVYLCMITYGVHALSNYWLRERVTLTS